MSKDQKILKISEHKEENRPLGRIKRTPLTKRGMHIRSPRSESHLVLSAVLKPENRFEQARSASDGQKRPGTGRSERSDTKKTGLEPVF